MQITIPNYSKYVATDAGEIIRIDSGKVLKPRPLKNGYLRVGLTSDSGKRKDELIHRIICRCFNGAPASGHECVNHKNADKTDNRPSNLEWCSYEENMYHASANNLLESQSRHMALVNLMRRKRVVGRDMYGNIVYDFPSIQIARDNGHSSVSYSIKNKAATKGGIRWQEFDE